jgi:phosphopantetheinyl transferase (holo-ACP synthase)
MQREHGVVASALEVLEIAEVERPSAGTGAVFSPAELAYAASKSDPQRRLAARLAAKRGAARLLGGGIDPRDIEVVRGGGAPRLSLSPRAEERLRALGAESTLVSLSHGRTHAAASVLLIGKT